MKHKEIGKLKSAFEFKTAIQKELKMGNLQTAGKILNLAMSIYPSNKDFLNQKIKILQSNDFIKGELHKAVNYFNKGLDFEADNVIVSLLKNYPNVSLAYAIRGAIAEKKDEIKTAIKLFIKAIDLNPGNAEYHKNCGNLYAKNKEYALARKHLRKAIEINSQYSDAYKCLGDLDHEEGLLEDAVVNFEKALKFNPDFSEAANNLGVVQTTLGETTIAIENFISSVKINPHFAEAHNNLARAYFSTGSLVQAKNQCELAIDIKPDFVEALNNLANIEKELGNIDDAIKNYNSAILSNPNDPKLFYNLALAQVEVGKHTEAITNFRQALSLTNDNSNFDIKLCLHYLLKSLFNIGNFSILERELVKLDPVSDCMGLVGSIISRYNSRVNGSMRNIFCEHPLEYVFTEDLRASLGSFDAFVQISSEVLTSNLFSIKKQSLVKNGIQTAGNLFESDDYRIRKIKKLLIKNINDYKQRYISSDEGVFKNWPQYYDLYGWLVSYRSGGHIEPHIHENGWISGAVYINVPKLDQSNDGNFVVCIDDLELKRKNSKHEAKIVEVNTGTLCLFPSSLLHYTLPFSSEEDRVVLAFDLVRK